MKRALIAATMVLTSVTAFAGKRERDKYNSDVVPVVKDAEAKFKASCGCELSIVVDDSSKTSITDILKVKYTAEEIVKEAPKYCTDEASKKALCQLKTLVIAKAKEAEFTFKAGKGLTTHDGQSRASWDMMVRVLDK